MKTIKLQAIIEGVRSLKDRSLGINLSTPELTSEEKAMIMELQGLNLNLTIEPQDSEKVDDYVVNKDLDTKPQSVRMRNCLFILWKKDPQGMEFESFYKQQTEKIIEWIKRKIDA